MLGEFFGRDRNTAVGVNNLLLSLLTPDGHAAVLALADNHESAEPQDGLTAVSGEYCLAECIAVHEASITGYVLSRKCNTRSATSGRILKCGSSLANSALCFQAFRPNQLTALNIIQARTEPTPMILMPS